MGASKEGRVTRARQLSGLTGAVQLNCGLPALHFASPADVSQKEYAAVARCDGRMERRTSKKRGRDVSVRRVFLLVVQLLGEIASLWR